MQQIKSVKTDRNFARKTLKNAMYKCKKVVGKNLIKQREVVVEWILNMTETDYMYVVKSILPNFEAKVGATVIKELKKDSPKSNPSYQAMSKLAPMFAGQSPTSIMSSLGVSRPKATRLSFGLPVQRKPNERKLTENKISPVVQFYDRDDISRADSSTKNTTKAGVRRNMNFYISVAYKMFIAEFKDIKISYSSFYLLKPKKCKNSFGYSNHFMSLCVLS